MEYTIEDKIRGVRIIAGEQARERRTTLNQLIEIAELEGFREITLPSIEPSQVYSQKAGPEILNQMYVFDDKKNRSLCLRPEGTATIQLLADKHFKRETNVKLWYFERCWRYERPQEGRYREFFQFGLELINPTEDAADYLISIAEKMVEVKASDYEVAKSVKRGLAYYTSDGFEISAPQLGSQKQIVGGGRYKQGSGFAIGFDRLMLCK